MGIMHRIRSLSPVIITTVMVLFLLLMVKPDNLEETINTIKRGGSNPAVGKVNGESILRSEFDTRVNEVIEQQRNQAKQQGKEDFDIDDSMVRQQVWDQMVQEKILEQEAAKAGVVVSTEEVADLLFENPPEYLKNVFKDSSGTFLRDVYEKLLKNPDSYGDYVRNDADKEQAVKEWKTQIKKITEGEMKQKLTTNIQQATGAGAVISPLAVRRQFDIDNNTADFRFVFMDFSRVADKDVSVSDDEIAKYYDQTKQFYKQKPTRKVKYVSFPIMPGHDDSVAVQKRTTKMSEALNAPGANRDSVFDRFVAEYNGHTFDFQPSNLIDPMHMNFLAGMKDHDVIGPVLVGPAATFLRLDGRELGGDTSVRASHVLIGFGPGNNKDSAKALAAKVYARAKKGDDFAALASEYSIDKSSAMRGGDVDYFGHGKMVPEFEKAAFAASVGSIVGPVETQFGYHIIKVVDKRFEKIKYSEIPMIPTTSSATKKALMREALSLKERLEAGGNIDTLAKQMKRMAIESAFFEKTSQMLGSFEVANFAFANDVGKVSKPLEIKGSGYTILQVTERRDAGLKPLKDVKEEIKNKLMKAKKLDVLKARAEALAQKASAAGSLDALKSADSTLEIRVGNGIKDDGNVPAIGHDSYLTAAVMQMKEHAVSGAIRGEKGYYVVQLDKLNKADEGRWAAEEKAVAERLRSQAKQNGYYQWYNTVKEHSEIEDYRSELYGIGN